MRDSGYLSKTINEQYFYKEDFYTSGDCVVTKWNSKSASPLGVFVLNFGRLAKYTPYKELSFREAKCIVKFVDPKKI